jgi:hypothetical protein
MQLQQDIKSLVLGLSRVYRLEGKLSLANLLSGSKVELEEVNYDNWNGGTYTYALHLSVPPEGFVGIGDIELVEKELFDRLKGFTRGYQNEYLGEVIIKPVLDSEYELDGKLGSLSAEAPEFWAPERFRLFISHVSKEAETASRLLLALEDYGISGFVAHEKIAPAKEWEDEVHLALETMDALVALLSPDFRESDWTDQETGIAIGRGIPVIPVQLGAVPYGFIGKYQGFQGLRRTPDQIAKGVFEILLRNSSTQKKITASIVSLFEDSDSFAAARRNMDKLEMVRSLDTELKDRLLQALAKNSQISQSYHVPARLEALIKRLEQPEAMPPAIGSISLPRP